MLVSIRRLDVNEHICICLKSVFLFSDSDGLCECFTVITAEHCIGNLFTTFYYFSSPQIAPINSPHAAYLQTLFKFCFALIFSGWHLSKAKVKSPEIKCIH